MYNGIRTIYNLKLQNRQLCGLPYKPITNTTLNEFFGINVEYTNSDIYPTLNTIVIGNGIGVSNDSNILELVKSPHKPTNSVLSNHIPFYLRPLTEVSIYPPSDKLRLKKIITLNGIEYLICYGYKVDGFESNDDILVYNNIEEEYVQLSTLNLTSTELIDISSNTSLENTESKYISDFVKLYTYLDSSILSEIKNALTILNIDNFNITEIGLCTAIDGILDDSTATTTNNMELSICQIGFFIDINEDINKAITEGKLDFNIEVGGMEIINL